MFIEKDSTVVKIHGEFQRNPENIFLAIKTVSM